MVIAYSWRVSLFNTFLATSLVYENYLANAGCRVTGPVPGTLIGQGPDGKAVWTATTESVLEGIFFTLYLTPVNQQTSLTITCKLGMNIGPPSCRILHVPPTDMISPPLTAQGYVTAENITLIDGVHAETQIAFNAA